jgi:hypothetical protein
MTSNLIEARLVALNSALASVDSSLEVSVRTTALKRHVKAAGFWFVGVLFCCTRLATAQPPNGGPTQSAPPRELAVHPPFPNTTKPAEIRANLLWSLEQSHWDPALEQALRQGSIVFARTLDVESGLGHDYYLLEIDTTTGAAFRTIQLGKDGWIQADAPWNGRPRRVTAPDLQVVAQQLREKYGAVSPHYFHTYGTVESGGGGEFLPLVKAQTPDGTVLLVNSKGEVFRQLAIEPLQGATPEAKEADLARRRRSGKTLHYRDAVAAVEKIDTLPKVR